MSTDPQPTVRTFAGIFLVSAATLLYQITFTRIFSVTIWYHFAFLVVSVSLFGFGASGVVLASLPKRFLGANGLAWPPALFGFTAVVAYLGINAIPFSPFEMVKAPIQILYFALIVVLLTTPFVFAGMTVVLILKRYSSRAGSLYALDLIGASLGTLLLFIALPTVGASGAILLAVTLAFYSAAVLSESGRFRGITGGLALVCTGVMFVPTLLPDVRLDPTRQLGVVLDRPDARHSFAKWNALSRIDVVEASDTDPMLFIDAQAMTLITKPHTALEDRFSAISTAASQLIKEPSMLIIGPGGGLDVQDAVSLGAKHVTAVEINPIIIDLVRNTYGDYVGHVYDDPRVTLVLDEGRSYVDRSDDSLDIIQITLIDTWAASVSGAYSLSENYLYTIEAFEAYFDHLSRDGMVSITRWYFEMPRLVSVAGAALEARGVQNPGKHLAVIQRGNRSLLLAKATPFREDELKRLRGMGDRHRWEFAYEPGTGSGMEIYRSLLGKGDRELIQANFPFSISATTVDSPFFFQMTPWGRVSLQGLKGFVGNNHLEPLALPAGQLVLLSALVIGLVLSGTMLSLPGLRRAVPRKSRGLWLAYFTELGLAFIMVEVVLMQRFALFLGHPTYSVAAVLFAILAFSGLGSAWSDRRRGACKAVLGPLVWLLPFAILILAYAVPALTTSLLGLPHAARMAIAILIIGPLAFLMGVPFPVGIRTAARSNSAYIYWAWTANGCASVVGSVCAVLGAMAWNFSVVLLLAGVIYAVALIGLRSSREVLA